MAKKIILSTVALAIVIGTVILETRAVRAFSLLELMRARQLTVFAAGGLLVIVFVAVGAAAVVIRLVGMIMRS